MGKYQARVIWPADVGMVVAERGDEVLFVSERWPALGAMWIPRSTLRPPPSNSTGEKP